MNLWVQAFEDVLVRQVKGGGGEGTLSAFLRDDIEDFEHHVLLDFMEFRPDGGFGECVNEKVERRRSELDEVDDQGLPGIDFRVILQHVLHFVDDGPHFPRVVVTDADGFVDAAVEHA